MAEKVTIMVLKVDLQCPCCYKKVKKILCKFPQIRDQIFNEKANTVTITVICCDPEKVRDKLCCKGAKVIKSIEIKEPEKPKLPEPKEPKEPEKTQKPKEPKEPEKTQKPKEPKEPEKTQKPKEPEKTQKPKEPPPPPPPKTPDPDPFGGYVYPPVRTCCGPCSEGYGGGPCYFGLGVAAPPPPQPCFEGYYGYGYRERPCHVRCDYYFSEENPQACSIM